MKTTSYYPVLMTGDVAGTKAFYAAHFGFKTLWVNRGGLPEDNLPGTVVAHVKDLSHLPSMIGVS